MGLSFQKPIHGILAIFVGLAVVALLTACPRRWATRDDAPQKFHTTALLIAAMSQSRPASLRVTGMVEYRSGSKRIKVHMLYVAKKPATLRFETESFFDQPLSILVTDGMTFTSWDMKNGRFITGSATMENISRVIPVPMDGADIARMLLGQPPLIAFASSTLEWKQGEYILTLSNARQTETIVVDSRHLTPSSIKLSTNGRTTYTLELSDWLMEKQQALVPGKIRFEMPSNKVKVRIKLFDVSLGSVPDEGLFHLDAPDGVDIENWN